MYTRSFYSEDEKIKVPENYDGNAFTEIKDIKGTAIEKEAETAQETAPLRAPWDLPHEEAKNISREAMARPKERDGFFGELMTKLPFGNIFAKGNFLKNTFSDFGMEELLIIGVALFLLFSKDGDKECALILLFLIFVK